MTETRAASRETGQGRRVFPVGLLLISLSLTGFLLALIFQWPSDFVLGDKPDSRVTLGDFVPGTVTSIPLAPFAVLAIGTFLVRSRRWWGTLSNVVLTFLGAVFIVGGVGEITSDNSHVPKAVLVVAGTTYVLLGLSLVITGALDLISRWQSRARSKQ